MGVDQHAKYEENDKDNFNTGSIIVLGTDGIWESRNSSGAMLGKGVINEIIRENASRCADEIMQAVISTIRKFQAGQQSEDDLTVVVVKATENRD